jgi:hypothetical protein
MSSYSMVAADNCPSGMPRLLPAPAGCWGSSLVLEGQIPNPQPMLGWGPFGESFDARSAQRRRSIGSATGSGRSTAARRTCGRWWSRRSGIWLLPGRCAAGAGCCSGSGTSAGPPARWSASAGSCTRSHLKEHRRHPDWPIRIGPADASPSKQWHNRPARPSGLRRSAPPPRMHLPSAPSCARGRLAGARRRPGRTAVPGRAPSTADVAAPDPSVCRSVALAV